jgi:hypothetical protein
VPELKNKAQANKLDYLGLFAHIGPKFSFQRKAALSITKGNEKGFGNGANSSKERKLMVVEVSCLRVLFQLFYSF